MSPVERWGALVEFWDGQVQRADSDDERAYCQDEASKAWRVLEFYERNPGCGFDTEAGKIRWRTPLPKPTNAEESGR